MRPARILAALAATVSAISPAMAVTVVIGDANTGPQAKGSSDYAFYADFNSGVPAGLTGGSLRNGSNDSLYQQPSGDPTQYYSVGPEAGTPATLALANFDLVSFYWGSIDSYNTISFLGPNGSVLASFTGSQIDPTATPSSLNSRNVTFDLTQAEKAVVTGIRFSSTVNAFEFDNLAVSSAPEPAAWATMMLGIGLAGATLRRRKATPKSTLRPA